MFQKREVRYVEIDPEEIQTASSLIKAKMTVADTLEYCERMSTISREDSFE